MCSNGAPKVLGEGGGGGGGVGRARLGGRETKNAILIFLVGFGGFVRARAGGGGGIGRDLHWWRKSSSSSSSCVQVEGVAAVVGFCVHGGDGGAMAGGCYEFGVGVLASWYETMIVDGACYNLLVELCDFGARIRISVGVVLGEDVRLGFWKLYFWRWFRHGWTGVEIIIKVAWPSMNKFCAVCR